jgi:hypothetical protein
MIEEVTMYKTPNGRLYPTEEKAEKAIDRDLSDLFGGILDEEMKKKHLPIHDRLTIVETLSNRETAVRLLKMLSRIIGNPSAE